MKPLVLSMFPGIGMLDHAFEQEGFCVVRGPDLLWGGDIHTFQPPAGRFVGIIGGPPCQSFSPIANVNRARYGDDCVMPDLIPEFVRVIEEARPGWWLSECARESYVPEPKGGYRISSRLLSNRALGQTQSRVRRIAWGCLEPHCENPLAKIAEHTFEPIDTERTVSGKGSVDWKGSRARESKRLIEDMCELQGLPREFFANSPFTKGAQMQMIGNGVPIPMGRQLASAIWRAIYESS